MAKKIRVVIIGGGAAGLAAAVAAARAGASVRILDHMDRVGRKILSTGNGRCNYTNAAMGPEKFYSGHIAAVREILRQYPTNRILDFFEGIGVVPAERDGYYYPASGQAASVLDCLRSECAGLGVEICCQTAVKSAERSGNRFHIKTDVEDVFCDRLILACGGKAAPFTGSDGSGYELARRLGHRVIEPFPALTALRTDGTRCKALSGVRVRAAVELYVDGQRKAADSGELQWTENGLSGIVVFQISRLAVEALRGKRHVEVQIDFQPDREKGETIAFLRKRRNLLGQKELQEWGIGLFHRKLWQQLVREAGLPPSIKAGALSDNDERKLVRVITGFRVPVTGYLGFDRAQTTAGGIDLREFVPQTMESRRIPGLYMAGEMLDVDGICGGYNLHWAWASGLAAGRAAGSQAGAKKGKNDSYFTV